MNRFWNTKPAAAASLDAPSAALQPFDANAAAAPFLFGAMEQERVRQDSVNLLRDRAFSARQGVAEQQVQNQSAELVELRATLASDRQSAEVRTHKVHTQNQKALHAR